MGEVQGDRAKILAIDGRARILIIGALAKKVIDDGQARICMVIITRCTKAKKHC